MLGEKMQQAMNEQINHELYSSYLYLAMAAFFESNNLPGFASWMRAQSEEEREHAMKFFDFIIERGGKVKLSAIKEPPADFGSPLETFQQVLAHERHVTESINKLYALAKAENDYPSEIMLQWFVEEQVEEENSADAILQQLRMIGDQSSALLMLDHRLGQRRAE